MAEPISSGDGGDKSKKGEDNRRKKDKSRKKKYSFFKSTILIPIITGIIGVAIPLLTQDFINKHILHNNVAKLWAVKGRFVLEDQNGFDVEGTILSIKPPEQDIYGTGQFIVWKVPIEIGGEKKPSLLIKKVGYKINEIVLEERPPEYYEKYALQNYLIEYNKKRKLIEIKDPIILKREQAPNQEE